MRANRDDMPLEQERPAPNYTMIVAGASLLLLALLLYIGLRGTDEPVAQPVAMPVVRDSAVVEPPVVSNNSTAAAPAAQGAAPASEFPERRLAPFSATVGAGAAPVAEEPQRDAKGFIIDGPLLEELEEDAQSEAPAEEN